MPITSYIEVGCRCGRLVRATPEQGGTSVRCWNCGSDVKVPEPGSAGRVFAEFAAAARGTLSPQSFGACVVVALGTTVLLMVPYVGKLLGLGVLVVGARLYQNLIREVTPPARAGGPGDEDDVGGELPDWAEWALSAFAVAALMAPFWARSWAHVLIVPARWALLVPAFACWLVAPVVLLAFNARDRHGPVPPGPALSALGRHPVATAAALLLLPVGVGALEVVTVATAKAENNLVHIIDHVTRPPRIGPVGHGVGSIYRFDDRTVEVPLGEDQDFALRIYGAAVSRGFLLTGLIPGSLSSDFEPTPTSFQVFSIDVASMALRAVLTILILSVGSTLLMLQARWLGLVALLGTRRRTGAATPTPRPAPVAAPAPVPVSAPAPSPAPAPAAFPGVAPEPVRGTAARTVLVADGDRGFAVGVGRLLSDRGFGVILAGSATEAAAIIRGAHPDLVVLDAGLPDRSGILLCQEIRTTMPGPERPVLIATSPHATASEITAMATAADDYMVKPYVIEALIRRIDHHLKGRP